MKMALVGSTGFVGQNIAARHAFDGVYHASDVANAYGTKPEILFYAGLPAAKYLANTAPERDFACVEAAMENIRAIAPQRLVLISTVDVYEKPNNVDENSPTAMITGDAEAYGKNRAKFEQMVRAEYPSALIVRLPALFGQGLKKNFLYDFITLTPAMLKKEKYDELAAESALVKTAYEKKQNGFFALKNLEKSDAAALRTFFETNHFNALNFTDSRAAFQFYDLSNLWHDLAWALEANVKLLNIATEPLTAAEIYSALTHGGVFANECAVKVPNYDMKSLFAPLYGGENGYLYTRQDVLASITSFVSAARQQQ